MAAVKGRKHRTGVAGTVRLSGRVHPEQAAKAEAMATALGVSFAALLDRWLAQEQVDENGRPLWWTDPVARPQEGLPLPSA